MIIEHEDNPSWAMPSSPARQPGRMTETPMRQVYPKPARPSLARYIILGMVLVAMLAPVFMTGV
jgi:hypothetical protein